MPNGEIANPAMLDQSSWRRLEDWHNIVSSHTYWKCSVSSWW